MSRDFLKFFKNFFYLPYFPVFSAKTLAFTLNGEYYIDIKVALYAQASVHLLWTELGTESEEALPFKEERRGKQWQTIQLSLTSLHCSRP